MRILITGGFGFIGGRLGQHLHQSGHQVVLGSREGISPPRWLTQAEVVKTDWNDDLALERLCDGVEVIIHAAGMNAQDCAADPVAALEFNGLATTRLVAAASRAKVKRFTYLSTAHVYASPLVGRISEDTCPRNLHPYATSHLAGEFAVLNASQGGQIEGLTLRLSNAFGVPAHREANCWMLLVNDLCRQAALSGKMVLRSSGLQQRDFIAMAEVCRVVEHLSCRHLDASQGAINLGSGISLSVLEMAKLIQQRCKRVLGFEPELVRPEKSPDGGLETPLNFSLDGLTRMGVDIDPDANLELDQLLAFCQSSFGQRSGDSV